MVKINAEMSLNFNFEKKSKVPKSGADDEIWCIYGICHCQWNFGCRLFFCIQNIILYNQNLYEF